MSNPFLIREVRAIQVLDSRGDPTIEVSIVTSGGGIGRAIAPAGASRGKYEAVEVRDVDSRMYKGRGVRRAVENVNNYIGPAIQGLDARRQREIDSVMIQIDGTPNKSRLGANAMIATSLAVAKAAADTAKLPLFQYLGGIHSRILPIPMLNIINGGVHAGNELSVQEFMIVPLGFDTFSDAIRAAVEVYKELKAVIKERYGPSAINVGDEGGYAPPMRLTDEALQALEMAVKRAGYELGKDIFISLDAAASQFYDEGSQTYDIDGRKLRREELLEYWLDLVSRYPILSIEDPFYEEDFDMYSELRRKTKGRTLIVGDDLTVTNIERLVKAIEKRAIDAVIVKPNQVGTLTETLDFIDLAKHNGIATIISHRSGESEDTSIAHLAVAVGGPFIKTGAPCRGERTAKYNELLRIEDYLGGEAIFAAKLLPRRG